jgi:hypothetical protein
MKKLSLAVIAFYLNMLAAFSQATPADSSAYQPRKLKLSEINFVSGYYTQDGNNSAVTGGVGTEKLTDLSNTIELKFLKVDNRLREHNINFELGVDHYTSASSDKIDPSTISSPSYADTRIYPSATYSVRNPATGITTGVGAYVSYEYDYFSKGVSFNFSKASKDNNRDFGVKLQAYLDNWKIILPVELRGIAAEPAKARNSYTASFNYSQVVNKRLQYSLQFDLVSQNGLLGTSYQRVYFKNNALDYEHLPGSRFKLPVGMNANYFVNDRIILRSFYRYYADNWGVKAHTAELEMPVKVTPFISVSPFFRFYTQSAADYFAAFKEHISGEKYYTSDFDLSKFNSQFFGSGFRFTPEKGVFGSKHWSMLELRYGHYNRNTGLNSDIVSLNARFK